MSSTKENKPQIVVKGAPPRHSPAEHAAVAEPARHPHEERSTVAANPRSAQPIPTSHPLRWFLLLVLLGVGTAAGTAWYQTNLLQVIDDTHLVLQGNIDVRQVNLAFKVGGRIATLEVEEGDTINAGQTVATLDEQYFKDDLRLVLAQRDNAKAALEKLEHGSRTEEIAGAKAQLTEREATLRRAKQDFDRAKKMLAKHAVSEEVFDSMKGALHEAEARLTFAQESLNMIQTGPRQEDIAAGRAQLAAQEANVIQSERRLSDSILTAPTDGVVLTRARERGAIVSPGETIFAETLATPVWARTYVAERDLGRIEPGMAAEIRTDSAPGKVYTGYIGFISPAAEFTPKSVETRELRTDLVYRLRVIVNNPDGGLRQGMPVTVTLDVGQKD
jgi:HlyD family secretion protein